MLAHIAGIRVEEWLMPFIISAGAALVGMRHVRFIAELSEMVVELIDSAHGERAAEPIRTVTMLDKNTR